MKKKVDVLKIEGSSVRVKKVYEKEALLDAHEEKNTFSFAFIYYLLTFIAGFLVAKIKFKKRELNVVKESDLSEKIQNVKSLEELIMILAIEDSKKYENIIIKVETKEVTSIKEVKKLLGF